MTGAERVYCAEHVCALVGRGRTACVLAEVLEAEERVRLQPLGQAAVAHGRRCCVEGRNGFGLWFLIPEVFQAACARPCRGKSNHFSADSTLRLPLLLDREECGILILILLVGE